MTETYTIDASDKPLGRVASLAAAALRGKNSVTFSRQTPPLCRVTIVNASKLKLEAKKLKAKSYLRYSGYPGGLKAMSLENLIARKGIKEALRLAVRGMLPRNKWRTIFLQRLSITE
jgi:large subunit ribosomal protein L13